MVQLLSVLFFILKFHKPLFLGGDIDSHANDGATALYEASKNGHEDAVELLVSKKANMNKTTKAGLTSLHVAAKNGHVG